MTDDRMTDATVVKSAAQLWDEFIAELDAGQAQVARADVPAPAPVVPGSVVNRQELFKVAVMDESGSVYFICPTAVFLAHTQDLTVQMAEPDFDVDVWELLAAAPTGCVVGRVDPDRPGDVLVRTVGCLTLDEVGAVAVLTHTRWRAAVFPVLGFADLSLGEVQPLAAFIPSARTWEEYLVPWFSATLALGVRTVADRDGVDAVEDAPIEELWALAPVVGHPLRALGGTWLDGDGKTDVPAFWGAYRQARADADYNPRTFRAVCVALGWDTAVTDIVPRLADLGMKVYWTGPPL